jgi:hypothetical protein
MIRYLAGIGSALLLITAGILWWKSTASAVPTARPMIAAPATENDAPLVDPPAASEKTREEKRFARYDKDRSGSIMREEYLASRRKAWAKLDSDGDGRLSFDEWAAKSLTKFSSADMNKDGALDAAEFVTTRVARAPARRDCPPPPPRDDAG